MTITDVPGVRAGHWTDPESATGCTVLLLGPDGAVAGVDVRGSAPGTRETDLLEPTAVVQRVHAILLTGGSAFGLAAADGVMRFLAERGIGFRAGQARIPIVPAAVIFDLAVGSPTAYPGPDEGYAAAVAAESGEPIAEGRVGAGTGATVGKLLGQTAAMPGGVGTASLRLPGGATVGAIAVVNALGDVVDGEGRVIAGSRSPDGSFIATARYLLEQERPEVSSAGTNTTLAVVATDALLTKVECRKLAEMAQDALAISIRPVHTMFDGDTVFAVSTGTERGDLLTLGNAAVHVLRLAIERGVRNG